MKCPYCSHAENQVIDKRETEDEIVTRRRRECLNCQKRFTTYERIEALDLMVLKRDGRKEPFSMEKLKAGILKSCEKRPITEEQVDQIVESIETNFRKRRTTEIKSTIIGELVIKKLRALDEMAYIRFVSVYRNFDDLDSFKKELKVLAKK